MPQASSYCNAMRCTHLTLQQAVQYRLRDRGHLCVSVVPRLAAGDGRLGLLIAQVCALQAPGRVTHFGRHMEKMGLVTGTAAQVLSSDEAAEQHAGAFGLVIEASGACG